MFHWLENLFSSSSADVEADEGISMTGDDPFSDSTSRLEDGDDFLINPATGLEMIGDIGGIDIAGNPYGMDSHDSFSDPFGIGNGSVINDDW